MRLWRYSFRRLPSRVLAMSYRANFPSLLCIIFSKPGDTVEFRRINGICHGRWQSPTQQRGPLLWLS